MKSAGIPAMCVHRDSKNESWCIAYAVLGFFENLYPECSDPGMMASIDIE